MGAWERGEGYPWRFPGVTIVLDFVASFSLLFFHCFLTTVFQMSGRKHGAKPAVVVKAWRQLKNITRHGGEPVSSILPDRSKKKNPHKLLRIILEVCSLGLRSSRNSLDCNTQGSTPTHHPIQNLPRQKNITVHVQCTPSIVPD